MNPQRNLYLIMAEKKFHRSFLPMLLLGALLHLAWGSYAQNGNFQYYVINIANGLNTNNVNDCIKDKRGFLWMATDFGITRYSGQHSIHFSTDPATKKAIGHINKLLVTDSIIYAAGSTGLYTLNPQNCVIRKVDVLQNTILNDMVFYKDQIILSAKNGSLIFYTPIKGKVEFWEIENGALYHSLIKGDSLFCLTTQGRCLLVDVSTRKVLKKITISPSFFTDRLYLSKSNEILLSNKDYLKKFDHVTGSFISTAQFKNTTGFKEISDHSLFFITDYHQLNWRSPDMKLYNLDPPVDKSTEYKKIKGDLNDDVYIMSNQGVIIVRKVIPFTKMNVFGDQKVHVQRGIYEDSLRKRILFFSYDKLGIFDQQTKKISNTPLNTLTHTIIEHNDKLILISEGSKLYSLDLNDLSYRQIFIQENPSLQFIAAATSASGDIFLGSLDGLFITQAPIKGIKAVPLVVNGKSYSDMQVKAIYSHPDGKVWVGGSAGIFVLNAQQKVIAHYATTARGNYKLPMDEVNCFYATKAGLFVGLDGELVFIPFNGTSSIYYYTPIFGKSNNRIVSIVEDDYHDIWFASYKGVFRLTPSTGVIRSFHAPIYFTNDEFNRSASLRSKSGKLYFGNIAEYVEIDPAQYRDPIRPNLFQFNMARIFSNTKDETTLYTLIDGDTVTLPAEGASLDLSYSLNDPINHDQLTYQYRLATINQEWIDLSNRSSLQLFSLPAGNHHLQLRAIGNDGYNSNMLNLYLVVPAIFYKTLWFNLLMICFVFGLAGIFYWIRVRNLRKILQFRKEISYELHDAVGTTVTKSIYAAQSLMNETGTKDSRLQQIIDYGRQINANFRDVLWSLEKNTDPIVNLFDRINEIGNNAVANTPFDFQMIREKVDLDFPLPIRQKRDLLMISREAIHNVLKHSNGDLIQFHFSIQQSKLHLKISDNGINTDTDIRSGGMGLESMRLRARKMGAEKISFIKKEMGFEVHLIM